jgi:isopenicillin N synthase-like dioxygenase
MQAQRNFRQIPVLDIAQLLASPSPDRDGEFVQQLRDMATNVGFFYLTGHGVSAHLFDHLVEAAQRFFSLPSSEKMKVYIGLSKNHRGYVPPGEEVFYGGSKDSKEAFDLSLELPENHPDVLNGNLLLGPNQWPSLPGFAETVMEYYQAIFSVGRALFTGFAMALGEEPNFFEPYITRPPSQLRLIHYPFSASVPSRNGIGSHTDYECFTLLHSTAPGLEVLNGVGDWISVPPLPGALVVNIGDMMEVLSNGLFVATSHRVRKTDRERFSFPLFCSLDYDAWVVPLERFVTPDRPRRTGMVAGEHLYAQTAQTFSYQKARLARGEISLPDAALNLSSFGQEARLGFTAASVAP